MPSTYAQRHKKALSRSRTIAARAYAPFTPRHHRHRVIKRTLYNYVLTPAVCLALAYSVYLAHSI